MLINMRNAMMAGGGWKNPYVTDGLVAMWDIEWNAGGGKHVDNPTAWIDCIKQRSMAFNTALSWNNGEVVLRKTNTGGAGPLVSIPESVGVGSLTLEICGRVIQSSSDPNNGSGAKTEKALVVVCSAKKCIAWEYGTASKGKYAYSWENGVLPGTVAHIITPSSAGMYGNGVEATKSYSYTTGNYANGGIGLTTNNSNAIIGLYNLRLYSRALTADEIAANYAVDKARFNLPDAS